MLGYTALAFGMVVAAGTAAVLVLAPTDLIRDRLIAEVEARTGRAVTVAGPTRLGFDGGLAVSVADVSLSAPSGMQAPPTLRIASVEASVALWPLLSQRIEVRRLLLDRPALDLRIDRAGQASWQFARHAGRTIQIAQAVAPAGAGTASDAPPLPSELQDFVNGSSESEPRGAASRSPSLPRRTGDLALGDVRVIGGSVSYTDERRNAAEDLSGIDLKIALASLASPLSINGSFVARRERIELDTRIERPDLALAGRQTGLRLSFAGRPGRLGFEGQIVPREAGSIDGTLAVESQSLAGLIRYLGKGVADMPGLGAFKLDGKVGANQSTLTISQSSANLDGTLIEGSVAVEMGGDRPAASADLRFSELDLNRYMPVANAIARAPTVVPIRSATTAPAAMGGSAAPPAPTTRVKGYTAVAGWSDETFDLDALRAIDLDARLRIGKLAFKEYRTGPTRTRIALAAGGLRTTIEDAELYGGRGRGEIVVNAAGATPQVSIDVGMDGVSAQPLLQSAAGFDRVSGTAKLYVAVAGTGASQRQIVESLAGKASLQVANGAFAGVDVPALAAVVSQGRLADLDKVAQGQTAFSDLAATFAITGGVAATQDLRLTSPALRVSGTGSIDLGKRTLDHQLRPKLMTAAGDAAGGGAGIEVPIRLTGPWEKPQVTPDVDRLLKDPSKAVEAAREIGRRFKGKSADEILQSVTGGRVKGEDGKPITAKELLGRFLKQ